MQHEPLWVALAVTWLACAPCGARERAPDPPPGPPPDPTTVEPTDEPAPSTSAIAPIHLPLGVEAPPRLEPSPRQTPVEQGPLPVIWRTPLPDFCFPRAVSRVEDTLLACCGADAFLLDPETGEIRTAVDLHPGSCAFARPHDRGWVVGANVLVMSGSVVLARATYVARIEIDGTLAWRTQLDADYLRDAELDGDRLLVLGNTRDRPTASEGRLFVVEPTSGAITRWHPIGPTGRSLELAGDRLVVGRASGVPGLRSLRDGETQILADRPVHALVANETWVAAASSSDLFDPRPHTSGVEVRDVQGLEVRWSTDAVSASTALEGDLVAWVDGTEDRPSLALHDMATGRAVWRRRIEGLRAVGFFAGPFIAVHAESPSMRLVRRESGRPAGSADWRTPPEVGEDRMWVGAAGEIACLSLTGRRR